MAPALAPIFSMVHSRISRYSPELGRMLFQPAGAVRSAVGQSWEQRTRALKGRMMGQVDRLLTELHNSYRGSRGQRRAQIQAAFEEAYSGNPQSAQAKRIRTVVDQLIAEAQRAGLMSANFPENFSPTVFDRRAVADRRAEFEQMLRDKVRLSPEDAAGVVERILSGPGVIEGAVAPGLPVGTHETTLLILEKVGREQLVNDGWLLARHDAALFHWVDGVSKRAAWEAIFGPASVGFIEALARIEKQHGARAAREVRDLVDGALGRHPAGQSMPSWWRSTQEFITGWVGMTILAFSGIASIPELALPLVRAGGKVGIASAIKDFGQARQLARDLGIVMSDASEQVMWQMTGEQYSSPFISKAQALFFKLNGNELIVRTSRVLATSIGVRYLLNAAQNNDVASLTQLNLTAGDVIAWDNAGRPAWSPELSPELQGVSAKVADALNQFVNESTLNPSRFQATHWGNNPWLRMAWQLKHFLYTYGDTVLGGMYREMRRRWQHLGPRAFGNAVAIAMPALIFGLAVLPLAAASLELRDWIRKLNGQRGKEYEDALEYFSDVFTRAGGLGPLEFLADLRQRQEYGGSIFGAIGPVPAKIDMLFTDYKKDGALWSREDLAWKAPQLVPVLSQNKGLMQLFE